MSTHLARRSFLVGGLALALAGRGAPAAAAEKPVVAVHKSPT